MVMWMGCQDRGHGSVGMEFLGGVADALSGGVNADGEVRGDIGGPLSLGQHAQNFGLPGRQWQGIGLLGVGSFAGSFVKHVNQQGPAPPIAGDQWDYGHPLSLSGGALHPSSLGGRDMAGPCGGHGWAVAGAERSGAVEGETLEDFVAFPAQDLFGSISQNAFCLGVPENDVLVQIDAEGAVGGCFQSLQNVHAAASFLGSNFRRQSPFFCVFAHISHEPLREALLLDSRVSDSSPTMISFPMMESISYTRLGLHCCRI